MAAVVVEMTGQEHALWNSMNRVIVKQSEMEDKFRKVGKSGTSAMGSIDTQTRNLGSSLKNATAGFGVLAASIGAMTAALRAAIEQGDLAGKRLMGVEESRRLLTQVANTPGEYRAFVAKSKALQSSTGIDEKTINQIIFDAQSAGLFSDIDLLMSLKDIGLDPTAGIRATSILQREFGGAGPGTTGAGTTRQIVNKLLAAAASSPVGASEIATAAATATTPFASIGGSDEELLALLSVFATTTKSPEIAADRIKALSQNVGNRRARIRGADNLSGLALLEALPDLEAAGNLRSESGKVQTLNEFLGDAGAIEGATKVRQLRKEIHAVWNEVKQAELDSGTPFSKLASKMAIVADNPELAQMRAVRVAQEGADIIAEQTVGPANLVLQERRQYLRQRYGPTWTGWFAQRGMDAGDMVYDPNTAARRILQDPNYYLGRESRPSDEAMLEQLRKSNELLQQIRDTNRSMDRKSLDEASKPIRDPRDPALRNEGLNQTASGMARGLY
ncbi:MAG: hypothetical protein AB7N71_13295 [Phycisphaerae bacterium]